MRLGTDPFSRACRATFVLLMAFAWSARPQMAAAADGGPPPAALDAGALRRAAEQFGRVCDALDAAGRSLPRDTFDPAAVARALGNDPGKTFAWVRDHTWWVPYRGVLRGPTGVLMDRLGDSIDRSLLLASLLSAGGRPARLCRATLARERAAELLAKVRPPPVDPFAGASREPAGDGARDGAGDGAADVDAVAAKFGVDAAVLRANANAAAEGAGRAAAEAKARVADQAPALAEAFGAALPPPGGAKEPGQVGAEAEPAAVEALADHWWVQYQDAGRWVDLDPLLPDAQPGAAAAAPAETLPLESPEPGVFRLPEALYHEVRVRVIAERTDHGAAQERVVLSRSLRPAELFGQRVVLTHFPLDWPSNLDLAEEPDPTASLKSAALKQREWVPVLAVGPKQEMQGSVDEAGVVNEKPDFGALSKTGKGTSGAAAGAAAAFDPFGGAAAPAPAPGRAPSPGGALTAEWVEYEITAPGVPPEKIRREVFDLVGPAARAKRSGGAASSPVPAGPSETQRLERALALLGSVEMLPLGCRYSSPFVRSVMVRNVLANREPVRAYLSALAASDRRSLPSLLEKFVPVSGPLYGLAVVRHEWNPSGGDVYVGRANLLTYRRELHADPARGVVAREGFDVVANAVSVRPGATGDPRVLRLRQGVADCAAEAAVLADGVGLAPTSSASREFAAARKAGGPGWTLLRGPSDPARDKLRLDADVAARIDDDLAAGFAVLAPSEPLPVGDGRTSSAWWRLDPATGSVLGRTGDGWGGASMVEYAHLLIRLGTSVYGGWRCLEGVKGSSVLATPEQKQVGVYVCIGVAVLAAGGTVASFLRNPALTFGGLMSTAGAMGGVAAAEYSRTGKL